MIDLVWIGPDPALKGRTNRGKVCQVLDADLMEFSRADLVIVMRQPVSLACHLQQDFFFACVKDLLLCQVSRHISVGARRNA